MEHEAASAFPARGPSVSVPWPVLTGVFDDNHSHHSHVYVLRIENVVAYVFFIFFFLRLWGGGVLYVRIDFR